MGAGSQQAGGSASVLLRALALLVAATTGVVLLALLLAGAVTDLVTRLEAGTRWTALPLDVLLEALAAVAGGLCVLWLLLVVVATATEAVTGSSTAALRALSPDVVRRVVLVCCGVLVGGTPVVVPTTASAAEHAPVGTPDAERIVSVIDGLPVPDRAVSPSAVSPGAVSPSAVPRPGTTSRQPTNRPSGAAPEAGRGLVTVAAAGPDERSYVVRSGDSLWSIAERLMPGADAEHIDAAWRRIHRRNRGVIGDDPDLIVPGTRLRVPAAATGLLHPHPPGELGAPDRKDRS